jgi:hypothetical protein
MSRPLDRRREGQVAHPPKAAIILMSTVVVMIILLALWSSALER